MSKLNDIDFKNKCFTSQGKIFKFDYDGICYDRLVEFIRLLPVVAVGKSHLELMTYLSNIFKQLTSGGDDFKATYFKISNELFNYTKSFEGANSEDFLNANIDTILKFCALVCNTDDEDNTKYNAAAIDRKIEGWKADMNILDFFFLAKKLVPEYVQKFRDLAPRTNEANENAK